MLTRFSVIAKRKRIAGIGGLVSLLGFFLFLPFVAQLEVDDQVPVAKARIVSAQLFKLQNQVRSDHLNRLEATLAVSGAVVTSGFYFDFVRVDREQDLTLWPVVSDGLVRGPPICPFA